MEKREKGATNIQTNKSERVGIYLKSNSFTKKEMSKESRARGVDLEICCCAEMEALHRETATAQTKAAIDTKLCQKQRQNTNCFKTQQKFIFF